MYGSTTVVPSPKTLLAVLSTPRASKHTKDTGVPPAGKTFVGLAAVQVCLAGCLLSATSCQLDVTLLSQWKQGIPHAFHCFAYRKDLWGQLAQGWQHLSMASSLVQIRL